jgi:hypothetical protein
MSKRIYDYLRSYKFYNGVQEKNKISASQCGAPLLQLYLSQTTEVVEQPNTFTKATIGSISHIGMEHLVPNLNGLQKEHPMERDLPNGWKITGTADVIDNEEKIILDYKFQMAYAYKQLFKEGPDSSYNMQGAAYSWIYKGDYAFHIMSFITDHSPIKKDHPAEAIQVTKMPIYKNIDFERIMVEKTNDLQSHIRTGIAPDQCDDLWWRVVNGKKIPTRCAYYCQYKDVCPHYSKHQAAKVRIPSWG